MTELAILTEVLDRFRSQVGADPRSRLDELEAWLLTRIVESQRREAEPKTGSAPQKSAGRKR